MNRDDRIDLNQVLDDMYSDRGIVSSAARGYYYLQYATDAERKMMDMEDAVSLVVSSIFWLIALVGFPVAIAMGVLA